MNSVAETEEVKVTCPECGHEVGVKEDGTKVKVHKVAGVRCEGSDADVPSSETDPEGLDKGDPFDALEGAEGDGDNPNDETDPEEPAEPETGAQSSEGAGSFVHTIRVHNSCPYLADASWNAENAKVAAKAAQQAGHVLAGGEATADNIDRDGDWLLVNYTVPVK